MTLVFSEIVHLFAHSDRGVLTGACGATIESEPDRSISCSTIPAQVTCPQCRETAWPGR